MMPVLAKELDRKRTVFPKELILDFELFKYTWR